MAGPPIPKSTPMDNWSADSTSASNLLLRESSSAKSQGIALPADHSNWRSYSVNTSYWPWLSTSAMQTSQLHNSWPKPVLSTPMSSLKCTMWLWIKDWTVSLSKIMVQNYRYCFCKESCRAFDRCIFTSIVYKKNVRSEFGWMVSMSLSYYWLSTIKFIGW